MSGDPGPAARRITTTLALVIGALVALNGLALVSVQAQRGSSVPFAGGSSPAPAPPPPATTTVPPPPTTTTAPAQGLIGDKRELIVFLQPSATESQVDAVRRRLAAMTDLQSVRFVDKAGAYEDMKRFFANHPEVMSAIDVNDAPVNFHVLPQSKVNRRVVGARLAGYAGVLNIAYPPTTGPRLALP